MTYGYKGLQVMDTVALAQKARQFRREQKLKQDEVAQRLYDEGRWSRRVSQQMIGQAEDVKITRGEKLHELRIAIVEMLEGRKLMGPIFVYEDELKSWN